MHADKSIIDQFLLNLGNLRIKCHLSTPQMQDGLELKEHEAARWLSKEKLYSVDWLPADVGVVERIEEEL